MTKSTQSQILTCVILTRRLSLTVYLISDHLTSRPLSYHLKTYHPQFDLGQVSQVPKFLSCFLLHHFQSPQQLMILWDLYLSLTVFRYLNSLTIDLSGPDLSRPRVRQNVRHHQSEVFLSR